MIPAVVDIEFTRGDSFSKFFRARDRVWDEGEGAYVPGPYKNLTGWTGLAQVRATLDSSEVLFEFTVTLGNQGTTPGSFYVECIPATTQSLSVLAGVWDLQWTTAAGKVYTYAKGAVKLNKDVTHA